MLIKNARIFRKDDELEGDLRFQDGIITEIGTSLEPNDEERVCDLEGLWLWPGAIDAHVHFRQPGPTHKEDWQTGSMAATAGGVTTVFDMPNTDPTTTSEKSLAEKRALAKKYSLCNFGLFFGASTSNLQQANQVFKEVPGLKIFMGCSTGNLLVYKKEDLEPIFRDYKGLICVHAESETRLHERAKLYQDQCDSASIHSVIRDPESAREAVELASSLAVKYGRDVHVLHLSTKRELDEIAKWQAKNANISITCEVCPHHLFLSTDDYERFGTLVRMNPPLRDPEDVDAMWAALKEGKISMIATDHAPHTLQEKRQPYINAPSGVPGVETMLPLMLDAAARGRCTYREVLMWLSQNPAKVYGLKGRGELNVGSFADMVVIDPQMKRVIRNEDQFSKCKWTPWHGLQTQGWPVMTFVHGNLVYRRDYDGVGEHVLPPGFAQDVYFDTL